MSGGMRAGLYLRLSREDEERGRTSESIQNQRDFLLAYCRANGFDAVSTYQDDGYTGTNYERPGFRRLLADIEAGRVDVVLTKDLSRLGRDYILTGHYLERYFPEHGVRYIAVNDHIDTAVEQAGDDMTPIRAVFNDLYAKDISRKVRTALTTKRRGGKFIGSGAPYGYRKDPADHNHLLVDSGQAAQVRCIYAWFLAGTPLAAIARRLTEQGVPTPSAAKGRGSAAWSDAMIRRILSMPTYCGDLVSNMSRKVSYKVDRVVHLPREEWIVVPGTHEAIVPRADFERAAQRLAVRGYTPRARGPKVFTGLLFCGRCGAPLVLHSNGKRRYYVCSAWKRAPAERRCQALYLREDDAQRLVGGALRRLAREAVDPERVAWRAGEALAAQGEARRDGERLEHIRAALLTLYRDRGAGLIGEEDFAQLSATLRREEEGLRRSAARPGVRREELYVRAARLTADIPLDRQTALALIERIDVSPDRTLFVRFRFADPYAERAAGTPGDTAE